MLETDMSEVHPYQPSEGACETGARHSFLWFLLRPHRSSLRVSPPLPVSPRVTPPRRGRPKAGDTGKRRDG